MEHNRSLLVKENAFDPALVETYGEIRDEFQQGLPEEHEPEREVSVVHLERSAQEYNVDRVEITQQQLSRVSAFVVLAGFGMFFLGYLMARYQPQPSAQFVPTEIYGTFFDEPIRAVNIQSKSRVHGRYSSYREADMLRKQLAMQGYDVAVMPHSSYSTSGVRYEWFSVETCLGTL